MTVATRIEDENNDTLVSKFLRLYDKLTKGEVDKHKEEGGAGK